MTQWGLDTLFNPAKRHMDEEKRRLQSTREQLGDSSGGKRIDLESGKVTIQRAASAQDERDEAQDDRDAARDDGAAAPSANGKQAEPGKATKAEAKGKPAPSPAAVRAAKRRGRDPR